MRTEIGARRREGERSARTRRERKLAALALRQHGVVSRGQLLAAGLGPRTVRRRVAEGRLHPLHRGIYAWGSGDVSQHGEWMAALLGCGEGAILSHSSAAALWGIVRPRRGPVDVTVTSGRRRPGVVIHEGGVAPEERAVAGGISVTSVARTLLDYAEVVDEARLERAFEEADRLQLLDLKALEEVCSRGFGRRGLRPLRASIDAARLPEPSRSALEAAFLAFCRREGLPSPQTNVSILDREVDACWPAARVVVEVDGWSFHRHRAAFERDRARDAAMQAAGYRVVRVTHRRLEREPAAVAAELRRLLDPPADVPRLDGPNADVTRGTSGEVGQGAVEWVGALLVVGLLLLALTAAGARVPGTALAGAVASKLLCAVSMADSCGDEPKLIAAYGSEIGKLVRDNMPSLLFEPGSRALPVDFRRCRSSACADGPERGLVDRSGRGLPVTAFSHVVDCRTDSLEASRAEGYECGGRRRGNLYLQYWLYYPDSATLRGAPIAGDAGYHRDDWESVQLRIGSGGQIDQRASSHRGHNYARGAANWGSDAGLRTINGIVERLGARPENGWGPATHALLVSGGSHAGNSNGLPRVDRIVLGSRIQILPLEEIASRAGARFAVAPPWRKRVWADPEAEGTD